MRRLALLTLAVLALAPMARAGDGNRLAYLDGDDPYYPSLNFPKLTTPQWVGEPGVEAVVVLAIDDMNNNIPKYETVLRPILDRLKAIDGRAPVSIMTCRVDPKDQQLQTWLEEGVNLDIHTLTHPCPFFQKGDFKEAARVYHECVDLMHKIPGNRPVAFRMPCCDSLNTPSPRFYAEIFNRSSPESHFLAIDSSVFNILTADDPALPRELVNDADGRERFRKYLPFKSFVNTIENYPYPYVINRQCWEFPCVVPSDWEAQNLQKPNNPKTVEDLKAALDAVVLKQGVFNLVFHPHGWIKPEQIVELIDHAVKTHGKKVKFLNFREAQERLRKNLLADRPLDGRVRLLDLNDDGFMDVVIGSDELRRTRRWDPAARRWEDSEFPIVLISTDGLSARDHHAHFGVVRDDHHASFLVNASDSQAEKRVVGAWHFDGRAWVYDESFLTGLPAGFVTSYAGGIDSGVRFRDIDGDGRSELIASFSVADLPPLLVRSRSSSIYRFSSAAKRWERLPFDLPGDATLRFTRTPPMRADENHHLNDIHGRDAGVRFVDIDEDGRDDVVFSNDEGFGVYLFDSIKTGWSRRVIAGKAGAEGALPPIVRVGPVEFTSNNGFWAHSRSLWWQNEDTDKLPDHVDRRSFNDLLKDVEPRAKSAEASLNSIRVRPGFKVELVASEPLIMDPIAFDWGPDGKLWVVEMGDYPLGEDGKGKPGGIVRFLEDQDADCKYDKSAVFLDGLGYPTGLIPWRKGVIVAAVPDIFYAEDKDGDGKADVREVLFTGFPVGNPQHLINGFDWGLDGWLLGANGHSGGTITGPKLKEGVSIASRDFRFQPDSGRFEAESGQTQYGRHRNDWGDWFGNDNSNLGWHYVLDDHAIRRNPHVAIGEARQFLRNDARLFPISRTVARFNDPQMANRLTSANSPTPYRDDLFGPEFEGNLFVSEPVHNLIRRVVLQPDGVGYQGHRAVGETDREFLASSDNWTRPTMLRTGPDGALWVADMYRAVIEHPEWIPDDWEAKLDLRAGYDKGRIYRVYPVDRKPRPIPRLDRLDTTGLVAALESSNGWQRDMAQQLLMQSGDRAAVGPLKTLATESKRPKVRLQALWTLEGLGSLDPETLMSALKDEHPEVRRQAVRVSERLLKEDPTIGPAVARLASDPEIRVRFEVARALGNWDDSKSEENGAGAALARIVRRDPDDHWIRAAVLTSAGNHAVAILRSLFADARTEPPPTAIVEPLFATAAAAPGNDLVALVRSIGKAENHQYAPWQFSALAGLLDAAERSRTPLEQLGGGPVLGGLFDEARRLARDESAPLDQRRASVRLLGREARQLEADRDLLKGLLAPRVPADLQRAAVAALARSRDPRVADLLLENWKEQTPGLRAAILDSLVSRGSWASRLIAAIEADQIKAAEIDSAHRRSLLENRDPAIRDKARDAFAGALAARKDVLDRYESSLELKGDPNAGLAVFKRVCASCHRFKGEGTEVGADLASLTDKSPRSLLIAILDPNRAFEAKFTNYAVATTDGRVLAGLIAAETANSVTLRRQEGKQDVLLRSEIESMAASGQSLMPEGLEKDLTPRDLADVIAYVASSGPPRKILAGNRPETVAQGADGSIVLRASTAEVYGPSLTFEPQYGNLGYWSAAEDHAAWEIETERPGRFEIWLDYACANDNQNNGYVLDIGPERLEGRVAGTGTWDDYKRLKVGVVNLPAGRRRLEIRPAGPIQGALMDLRALELRPIDPK